MSLRNEWNEFRKEHKGQGLSMKQLSELYQQQQMIDAELFAQTINEAAYDGYQPSAVPSPMPKPKPKPMMPMAMDRPMTKPFDFKKNPLYAKRAAAAAKKPF